MNEHIALALASFLAANFASAILKRSSFLNMSLSKAILKPLREASINVLYFYTFLGRGESGQPIVIIGVDKTAEAAEALKKNWVQTLGQEIYSL